MADSTHAPNAADVPCDNGWKKGPLPAGTWMWGGVVPITQTAWGFQFADFKGDHVRLMPTKEHPDGRRLEPHEVKFYKNALELPPREWFKRSTRRGDELPAENEGKRLG